jgi:hypothetical protein
LRNGRRLHEAVDCDRRGRPFRDLGASAKTSVAGWTIGLDDNRDCQATYSYKDADDDDAENTVVISLVEEKGRKVPDV